VLLEPADNRLHLLHRQVDVTLDATTVLVVVQNLFERLLGKIEHHTAVHLDEAAVGVPRKTGIAALRSQSFHRHIIEPQIEDGLHHARHRHRCSRPNRHQQRVLAVAQVLPGGGFQPLQRVLHLGLQPLGELAAFQVVDADVAGNCESRRDWYADGGHLGETGTLPAEDVFHG
jgi:hypothetical protein